MPPSETEQDDGQAADRTMTEMQEQLRKDTVSWAKERASSSARRGDDLPVPVTKPASRARKAAQPVAVVVKPAGGPKKPFGMSYDGVTDAENITYMINRGRR